jgi:hypothetical protein
MPGTGKNTEFLKVVNQRIGTCMREFNNTLASSLSYEEIARRITIRMVLNLPIEKRGGFSIGSDSCDVSCDIIEEFYNSEGNDDFENTEFVKTKNGNLKEIKCYILRKNDGSTVRLPCHISLDQIKRYYQGAISVDISTLRAFCQVLHINLEVFMSYVEKSANELDGGKVTKESLQASEYNNEKGSNRKEITKIHYLTKDHYNRMISEAKNSVFISGVGMQSIEKVKDMLINLKEDVSITLALPGHNDTFLKKYLWRDPYDWEWRRAAVETATEDIKKVRSVRTITLDTFLPTTYVAVDYKEKSESSFICVGHYLLSTEKVKIASEARSDRYCYFVTPEDGKIYDDYLKQVELIEKHGHNLTERYGVDKRK